MIIEIYFNIKNTSTPLTLPQPLNLLFFRTNEMKYKINFPNFIIIYFPISKKNTQQQNIERENHEEKQKINRKK